MGWKETDLVCSSLRLCEELLAPLSAQEGCAAGRERWGDAGPRLPGFLVVCPWLAVRLGAAIHPPCYTSCLLNSCEVFCSSRAVIFAKHFETCVVGKGFWAALQLC